MSLTFSFYCFSTEIEDVGFDLPKRLDKFFGRTLVPLTDVLLYVCSSICFTANDFCYKTCKDCRI